jgi:hypothetical protein
MSVRVGVDSKAANSVSVVAALKSSNLDKFTDLSLWGGLQALLSPTSLAFRPEHSVP